eukprot:Polyplicarium_translucidae@DN2029_c0_g1_i5.p1
MEDPENVEDTPSASEAWSLPEEQDGEILRKWKYLPGGERLSRIEAEIPHYLDTEAYATEEEHAELCKEIEEEARLLKEQRLYTKQRADTLQQEKDLLLWHLASVGKVKHLRQARLDTIGEKVDKIRRKLLVAQKQTDIAHRKNEFLDKRAQSLEQDLKIGEADFDRAQGILQNVSAFCLRDTGRQALETEGDSLADTTAVRRKVERERVGSRRWDIHVCIIGTSMFVSLGRPPFLPPQRLRVQQRERLRVSCNAQRKWMRKVECVVSGTPQCPNFVCAAWNGFASPRCTLGHSSLSRGSI